MSRGKRNRPLRTGVKRRQRERNFEAVVRFRYFFPWLHSYLYYIVNQCKSKWTRFLGWDDHCSTQWMSLLLKCIRLFKQFHYYYYFSGWLFQATTSSHRKMFSGWCARHLTPLQLLPDNHAEWPGMCLKAVLAHREQGERGEGRHWIAYLKVQNIWWKTDSASAHILQGDPFQQQINPTLSQRGFTLDVLLFGQWRRT